jgi:hypothetical protein
MTWLALAMGARAENLTARYCVDYDLDFTDGPTGDLLTGDTMDAIGVVLRFTWTTGSVDYALGSNGCKDITVASTMGPSTVDILRRAHAGGNLVEVASDMGGLLASPWLEDHTPVPSALYSITLDNTESINILAAASFALQRHNVGITGETFRFVLGDCPDREGTSCERWPEWGLYIHEEHAYFKFVIVHELAHALSDAANGGVEDRNDEMASVGACTPAYTVEGHRMNSKEFQSNAAVEGLAHYYSALIFNEQGEGDCEIEKHYTLDWNRDGLRAEATDVQIFSCEDGIPEAGINSEDYLGDYCLGEGVQSNRGTEYDWLRHLWDFTEQASPETLFELWDHADPHSWHISGAGTGAGYPAHRMSRAAYEVGGEPLQELYDASALSNGTWR